MTSAEAWFNNSLCPRKLEGSLGRTAQGGHLDSHTAPELLGNLLKSFVAISRVTWLLYSASPPGKLRQAKLTQLKVGNTQKSIPLLCFLYLFVELMITMNE